MLLLVSLATANAKCDWSSLTLRQTNSANYYQWDLSGKALNDTCVRFLYTVYDLQTKKIDTLKDFMGHVQVTFNKKGKYKMYLKVWNSCKNCDTSFVREINLLYFSNCKFAYQMYSTDKVCSDSIVGEMTMGPSKSTDTCWSWYLEIFNGPQLNSLTEKQWKTMSDMDIFLTYKFDTSDLVLFQGPKVTDRILKHKFKKDGHYLVITLWRNNCLQQDTFIMTRITVGCNLSSVTNITKPTPKLLGIYDMMGRPVYNVRENEILIYIYSDGTKRKQMITK